MATFSEIKKIRLILADPSGFINIVQVATSSNLPATPGQQTLYNIVNTGSYVATAKLTGATVGDYKSKNLYISDTVISEIILEKGSVDAALPDLILRIISQLSDKKLLKSTGTGAESKVYTGLDELTKFYEKLYEKYEALNNKKTKNSTQKMYKMSIPPICGGNL